MSAIECRAVISIEDIDTHELLGAELIRKPLETLRVARSDPADAMTALLLSRTRFACSPHLEAIREVVSKADRESARQDRKPR